MWHACQITLLCDVQNVEISLSTSLLVWNRLVYERSLVGKVRLYFLK